MQIQDYFDFLAADDIRIRGHRIGIETVLDQHLRKGRRSEEIVQSHPTLSLEEVHATIHYYLRNRDAIDRYLAEWREFGREARERQRRDPPPGIIRLRERLTEPNTNPA